MVGRSKPQKKMEAKSNVDFASAEIAFLKRKNQELAKALADSKALCSQMIEERDIIQRDLFTANLRYTKLQNYIKTIDSAARACINSIVTSSNHVTEVLQATNGAMHVRIGDDITQTSLHNSVFSASGSSSPALPNKTQAVKPMIGGHVILRPTINLRRINEVPIEEIQRLQSGSQIQTANHSSGNTSAGVDQNRDNLNLRTFRSRQPLVDSVAESFSNNEVEDEYTDNTSEISDNAPLAMNNGLETVQEEDNSELEHSLPTEPHLSPLASPSNTSLNIPGGSSQVPLLSGVFRDVRVYLSPMQNVAQYLDRLQNVTTERGSSKAHKAKRSHSIHSTRSPENLPQSFSSTPVKNRRPSATNISSNSMSQNQTSTTTTSSASLEDSLTATLQNSMLSSTKISTVQPDRSTMSRPEDLNWLNVSNNYENSTSNLSAFADGSDCALINAANLKFVTTERRADNGLVPKTPDFSTRKLNRGECLATPADYDPLEGPSTMLDSIDSETKNKIQTLSELGLIPTSSNRKQTPDQPPSPARTVLQRRERRKSEERAKANNVTKRKVIEKKKAAILSTKVAKVVIKRLSVSKNRLSGSPQKRKSLDTSQRRSSSNSSQRRLSFEGTSRTENATNLPEEDSSVSAGSHLNSSVSSASTASGVLSRARTLRTEKPPPKKRGRKSKHELSELQESKKSESPNTPRRRGRPRRGVVQASLKEPSLRKKLRRSK